MQIPYWIDFRIWFSLIPVPPCKTSGKLLISSWMFANKSKFKPFQSSGYKPWILPIPTANASISVFAISLHSSKLTSSPSDLFAPIVPNSASTLTSFNFATSKVV